MRAIVQSEVGATGTHAFLPLITISVITDGEGIAEAAGRRWRFTLADDGAGGTRATVTRREATSWVG